LAALRAHATDCESARGRFFNLLSQGDAVRSFAESRLVSTFLLILVLLVLILWLVD